MSPSPDSALRTRALRRVGSSLCGRYTVRALIGAGGMGAVYAGVHRNGHAVAIKILHERLSHDPEIERMFRREAQLANKINHVGFVPVIDDDISEDGCIFLVMPLLKGETLRARAERCEGRLPVEEVVVIGHALLEALAAAHEHRIVHRDIKPENIFVTHQGEIKVLDLGIARFFETSDPASMTRSGRAVGTPAFMAPEQALGRVREVDGRTDLWAAGATMFTLLSGRLVHEAETAEEILVATATTRVASLFEVCPNAPKAICEVVDRALSFGKADRWPTSRDMLSALDEACRTSLDVARVCLAPLTAPMGSGLNELHFASTVPPSHHGLAASSGNDPGTPALSAQTHTNPIALTRTLSTSKFSLTPLARRRRRLGALGALGVAAACTAMVVAPRSRAALLKVTTPITTALQMRVSAARTGWQAGQPDTSHADAEITLESSRWRTAWLDGDATRVRDEADRSIERDPQNARAHFAYVVASHFWPDEAARHHFTRARELRDQLTAPAVAYLDAIAPGMTVPPDFALSATKLRALFERDPTNVLVRMGLADMELRQGDLDGPRALLRPLVEGPSAPGLALSRFAHLSALADDVDTARTFFRRCLDGHPGAQVCAEPLVTLEMNEGHCGDAERILRRQISVSPDANAYLLLASTLERQHANADEVYPVLKNWVRASPEEQRERNALRADIRVGLMRGKLRETLSLYDRLGTALENVPDDGEQFDYTGSRMALEAELGMPDAAAATLASYARERNAFQRDVAGEDNISYLQATGVELSVFPWSDWVTKRDARLAHATEVDGQLDGKARSWLQHFAIPSTTPAAASEALSALPRYLPILHRADRDFVQDAAVSRVYALAGRVGEALPFAQRAAGSCGALEDLVQFGRAQSEAADLLARTGHEEAACRIYAEVLGRWPLESGSVTAARAEKALKSTCPAKP